jgi:hypothetical protein
VQFINRALLALKRILVVIGIAVAFSFGLFSAVYLSLRSSETKVPDIVGKDRTSAETTISDAGLNFRVRALRASSEAKPNTVLIQLPRAGEIVKVGQTVAVDISRPTGDGEVSTTEPSPSTANSTSEAKPVTSENGNTQANANENKPKRKPVNKNANYNENGNLNANRIVNRNRNANVNSVRTGDENANRLTPSPSVNRPKDNSNRGTNVNRRPIVEPTP